MTKRTKRGTLSLSARSDGPRLTPRLEELRDGLVHPVHQQPRVFAYEVLGHETNDLTRLQCLLRLRVA
jgi:hypothetical protein